MTYGIKVFKNGKTHGYLIFDSGKHIVLNPRELTEIKNTIRYWKEWTKNKAKVTSVSK